MGALQLKWPHERHSNDHMNAIQMTLLLQYNKHNFCLSSINVLGAIICMCAGLMCIACLPVTLDYCEKNTNRQQQPLLDHQADKSDYMSVDLG